ncbi:hypothetical protein ACLESO_24525 [Pyxidicoccus sp. 3LG]
MSMGFRAVVVLTVALATGCGSSSSGGEKAGAADQDLTPDLVHVDPNSSAPVEVEEGCGDPVDAGSPVDAGTPMDAGTPPPSCSAPALRIHDCGTPSGYQVTRYTKPDPGGPKSSRSASTRAGRPT